MLRFHVNVYVRPSGPSLSDGVFDAFFSVTFEAAAAALSQLPRADVEPDGFFVVSGEQDGRRWQVDGHLFDFDERLHRVALHGQCPPAALDRLLACLSPSEAELVFELIRAGVVLEEAEFRRVAASDDAGRCC